MKKVLSILMITVLVFFCYSCGEKPVFEKGNLLYDLGAESFNDIEKVEILIEDYEAVFEDGQSYPEPRFEITESDEIEEILSNYVYSSDYPEDKLNEIFVFPADNIYVTIGGIEYQLYVGDDYSLTTVPRENIDKACTYKAENGKGLNASLWEQLIKSYL